MGRTSLVDEHADMGDQFKMSRATRKENKRTDAPSLKMLSEKITLLTSIVYREDACFECQESVDIRCNGAKVVGFSLVLGKTRRWRYDFLARKVFSRSRAISCITPSVAVVSLFPLSIQTS